MLPIAGSILIALTESAPDQPTDFDLFIRSFKQHLTDQRALLPLLGIGLLIAVVVGIDILIGLRLARASKHASPQRSPAPHDQPHTRHDTGSADAAQPTPNANEQTHSMLGRSYHS